jgi:outer membrane protein TolC
LIRFRQQMSIWAGMGFLLNILAPHACAQVPEATTNTVAQEKAAERLAIPPRLGVIGQTELSLSAVIEMTLANNRDIESARIDTQIAGFSLMGAKGAYDPRIGVQSPFAKTVTPMSSVLAGAADGRLIQRDLGITPQISGLLPWSGASYTVSFASRRSATNNSFTTINPQFPTSLSASITQPLLRGRRYDASRQRIEVTRKNKELTDEQFRQRVTEVVAQAEKAYWDLVFARRNLEVQIEAANAAQRQVDSNRRLAEQGVLAPIDIVEAETQLSTLVQNVYNAQAGLGVAENNLKVMILPGRTSPLWSTELLPTTPLDSSPPVELLADAVNAARANRPELAQVRATAAINQANLRYAHDQIRPQVDLVASYTASGLAGALLAAQPNPLTGGFVVMTERLNELSAAQGLPPISIGSFGGGGGTPPALIGGYGQSLSNLSSLNFPSVQVSLQISLPLRNRVAEANRATALAENRRSENRREQVEQQIESEVRNAMQALESFKNALEAARTTRRTAEEQYASEQRKFQAGTSTVFLVLQRQTAMVTARNSELRAQGDLAKAVSDFERVTGRTLAAHRIAIGEVVANRR